MQFCELVVPLNAWFEVKKKGKVIDFLIVECLNRSCSNLGVHPTTAESSVSGFCHVPANQQVVRSTGN